MATRSSFNLENSIHEWENNLSSSLYLSQDNIEELKDHLLEEMAVLQEKDLSVEESFIISKKRMGNSQEITSEYAKVNKSFHRRKTLKPYILGILLYISFINTIDLFSYLTIISFNSFNIEIKNLSVLSLGIPFIATLILVFLSRKWYQNNSRLFKEPRIYLLSIGFIIVSKVLIFGTMTYLVNISSLNDYGLFHSSLYISKTCIGLILLVASMAFFYIEKNDNRLKLAH